VSVTDNVVTYQNVHITVPWDVSNPAKAIELATQAAAGKGLQLTDGKLTLEVSSDGKTLRLDGRSYGALRQGDRVVLMSDGTLTVNGVDRAAEAPTTTSTK
jgi:hypothetical protein